MSGDELLHQLLALSIVIVMARVLGLAFRRLRQPLVVGEIIAGIALGPSLLGWVAPGAFAYLFPPAVISFLSAISRLGVILYMFLVGLEIDPSLLRGQSRGTVAIAQSGIIAPFVLGALIAIPLYPHLSAPDVAPLHFCIFLGIAMAVTAFPVLARILTDRHIHNTPIGTVALGSAALGDLTIWCLLAALLGLIEARTAGGWATAMMMAGYLIVLIGRRCAGDGPVVGGLWQPWTADAGRDGDRLRSPADERSGGADDWAACSDRGLCSGRGDAA